MLQNVRVVSPNSVSNNPDRVRNRRGRSEKTMKLKILTLRSCHRFGLHGPCRHSPPDKRAGHYRSFSRSKLRSRSARSEARPPKEILRPRKESTSDCPGGAILSTGKSDPVTGRPANRVQSADY